MKKRQYIHPQIEILALTDCNELLSGSAGVEGDKVGGGKNEIGNPNAPPSSKQSSFSIFDDADDIYYLEEY